MELDYIVDLAMKWGMVVLTIIGAASVAASAIAGVTKTDKDDRVASILKKIHAFLSKIALNPRV